MSNRIEIPVYTGEPIDLEAVGVKYGFRHDPMEWINTDRSPAAARIRKCIFGQTLEGDEELVAAELAAALAKPEVAEAIANPRGPEMLFTVGWWMLDLLELECPLDHPQVVAAAAAMREQLEALNGRTPEDPEKEGMMPFRALCLLGMADHPTMKAWGRELLDRMTARLAECHQWTEDMQRRAEVADPASRPPARKTPGWPYGFAMELNTLWVARDTMDVTDALTDGLNWIADNFDGPGRVPGMAFDEAWSMAMIPGGNGHPAAGRIALKLIPYLLRMQEADGSWGGHSAIAFRALVRQGLLGPLASLPPLPPDWRTVRSIPAPGESPFNIAWDGGKIWVHDLATGSASGISPTDGAVLKTIKLPEHRGCVAFGAWDGSLWVLPGDPQDEVKTLFRVSPVTGETVEQIRIDFPVRHFAAIAKVSGRVLISDQGEGGFWMLDADGDGAYHKDVEDVSLACTMPDFVSACGDDVWTLSCVWFDGIMWTNAQRELLDWGESPFGHSGIAYDGERLWALDKENKRICVIEKTESGDELAR